MLSCALTCEGLLASLFLQRCDVSMKLSCLFGYELKKNFRHIRAMEI
ncbi:hypothetical protein AtDm6_3114 [Acetobacter tropicalis]|uniref:Uncharacterized protein n=1 Tax=Acetobacter tropicalis TaxID=104102 RepID=A0A094YKE5_9PROT|nr:hypothetical protein AtDm6_3114 [Acetobacter tropicalis]